MPKIGLECERRGAGAGVIYLARWGSAGMTGSIAHLRQPIKAAGTGF